LEYLLAALPEILEQIRRAKHILLLSDYDGTLTPIVENPELAIMPEETRRILEMLSLQPHLTLGIVSGRALADLKEKVNLSRIIYAGNHGFEIEGPGLSFVNPIADEITPFLRVLRQILTMTLGSIKGVLVEDKGLTLTVHYRQVGDEELADVRNIVERTVKGPLSRGIVKLTSGKKVYELRPAVQWDKGKAIRLLMKRYGKGGRRSGLFPVYLGDDLTDEDGFKVIEKYGSGFSVHIGGYNEDSVANYYLRSPQEVFQFLNALLEVAQNGLYANSFRFHSPKLV
jgi:trehalose 6-phosphate phosphatase